MKMQVDLPQARRAELGETGEFPIVELVPGVEEAMGGRPAVHIAVGCGHGRIALQPILYAFMRQGARRSSQLWLEMVDHAEKDIRRPVLPVTFWSRGVAPQGRARAKRDLDIEQA